VNGTKKWITNGMFCDYFVTAVRTGSNGIAGISLMLIERSEGFKTIPIKTSYSLAAGTAYVIMENVQVPI
jgi:alkylation response protein AidB-like acyl-CoA dehydrogenase